MKQTFFVVIIFLFAVTHATSIKSAISTDSITIGDPIRMTVAILVEPKSEVIPSEADSTFGAFVLKNWNMDRFKQPYQDSIAIEFILTTYEVDSCSIPALPFLIKKDTTIDTIFTAPVKIRVYSVIDVQPGDTVRMKNITSQFEAGMPSYLWLWILIVVIVITLIISIFIYRHINKEHYIPPPPPRPPYDEAVDALKKLEMKDYLSKGMSRQYVFELSDILKRYLGRRFDENISEFTTDEINTWLKSAPIDSKCIHRLDWFFSTSHMVKFAKLIPDSATVRKLRKEIDEVLIITKPRLEPQPEEKEEKQENKS